MSFRFSPKIVTDGLVLYLDAANTKSYSGSGTIWNDLTKNVRNGTLVNGPTFSSDNKGILTFNGINNYVIHDSIDLGTVCSWSIWVNYLDLNLISVLLGSNTPDRYTLFYYGNAFWVNYGNGEYGTLTYPTGLNTNQWYNITYSRNGATIKVYLNGVNIGSMVSSASMSSIFCVIGSERPNAYFSNVKISNVLLYNRELSAYEALQNYNATKARF